MLKVLHKKKDGTDCGNYRVISLMAHARNVLLKIVAIDSAAPVRPRDC